MLTLLLLECMSRDVRLSAVLTPCVCPAVLRHELLQCQRGAPPGLTSQMFPEPCFLVCITNWLQRKGQVLKSLWTGESGL